MNLDDYCKYIYFWVVGELIVWLGPLIYPLVLACNGKCEISKCTIWFDFVHSLCIIFFVNFGLTFNHYHDLDTSSGTAYIIIVESIAACIGIYVLILLIFLCVDHGTTPGNYVYNERRMAAGIFPESVIRSRIRTKAEFPPFILVYSEAGHDEQREKTTYYWENGYRYSKTEIETVYVKTYHTSSEFKFNTWEPKYKIPDFTKIDDIFTFNISTDIEFTRETRHLLDARINEALNEASNHDLKYSAEYYVNYDNYPDETFKTGHPRSCCGRFFAKSWLSTLFWYIFFIIGKSTVYEAFVIKNIENIKFTITKKVSIGNEYKVLYGQYAIIKSDKNYKSHRGHSKHSHKSRSKHISSDSSDHYRSKKSEHSHKSRLRHISSDSSDHYHSKRSKHSHKSRPRHRHRYNDEDYSYESDQIGEEL